MESRPPDESTLVARARRGEAAAYEELVRMHQAIAFRVALVNAGDRADAEEAVQDAFVKAYRARKPVPPEQTNAENYYYQKQMTNKTRMVILLKDGEEIRGTIEWYDKHAIKVHRPTEPNILLLKDNIKYMYKENEDKGSDED